MQDSPLVSIVIPTYNHRRYICDAVDSALAQTYPNCEIIVVDDGSDDGTVTLLKSRYGESIRIIYQENRGLSAARNTGTRQSLGEFVNYCDADDKLLPTKVARCMDVFEQHPDAAAVYTDYEHVADDGETVLARPHPPLPSGDIFCDLLIGPLGNFIHEAAPLVRRAAVIEAGGFNENLRAAEDWDLWLRVAVRHPFVYLRDMLTLYRQRPDAMHTDPVRMAESRLHFIQLARCYPGRERCLDDAAYDVLEAGRHHHLAMVYWQQGRRTAARDHLRSAMKLNPSFMRRLTLLMTHVLSARAWQTLERMHTARS
ncbi:MAG: glycosyltransferase [Anaerolineae bacterium]|nr:glycosyltransferase [Anaerolineae bacterium]